MTLCANSSRRIGVSRAFLWMRIGMILRRLVKVGSGKLVGVVTRPLDHGHSRSNPRSACKVWFFGNFGPSRRTETLPNPHPERRRSGTNLHLPFLAQSCPAVLLIT